MTPAEAPAEAPVLPAGLRAAGLRWHESGHATLTGPLLALATACDNAFVSLAGARPPEPEHHPAVLRAADLDPVDYLRSFPHLATLAATLSPEDTDLRAFRDARVPGEPVPPSSLTPPADVLTPAACYHVYLHHRGEELRAPLHVTTRNTCFRREEHYAPLRRQWSFQMRELVCVGSREEVREFLTTTRAAVARLMAALDLPVRWEAATDPFFDPAADPRHLAQRISPTKHEALYGQLALASVNLHEDHFGTAYGIVRDGRPASTGCVAFGIERWLYALTHRWGADPDGWPDVRAAAQGSPS
ncbi:hypothetical protein [Streptomyces bohaiensis]|uniref:Aminoacyl-transfer RNA synthetases class-II family profile domain-containing protein n=2 Tax=Streptomyces bohaiensis TaxID=1431344 RepID=A0ABX1C7W0_9ACTN|nr:hypothetical protein [Streptomyces bohaiensis]NJQ13675.1 hypothetical protein [Streptomyces bohaiensis]